MDYSLLIDNSLFLPNIPKGLALIIKQLWLIIKIRKWMINPLGILGKND